MCISVDKLSKEACKRCYSDHGETWNEQDDKSWNEHGIIHCMKERECDQKNAHLPYEWRFSEYAVFPLDLCPYMFEHHIGTGERIAL